MEKICTRYWLRYADDPDRMKVVENCAMDELGGKLLEKMREKPFGTRWVVSMGMDIHEDPQNPLAQERLLWLDVDEVHTLEIDRVAMPPMTDTEIATMKYNKEPLGKRIAGAAKLILGRL